MKQRFMLPLVLALAAFPAMADHSETAASAPPPTATPAASTTPTSTGGTDPKAISVAAPAFPNGLKHPRKAKVVLQIRVLADGRVDDVKVIQSGGEAAYDKTALAAAKNWKFSPATDGDGKPVDATITVPVTFDPGTGWADIDAQLQKIFKRSCRDFTAELGAWRRLNPDGKLEDVPSFKASAGVIYAMALTGPTEEMLELTGRLTADLPDVYRKVAEQCAARPSAVYGEVWAAALTAAPHAPR